MAPEPVKKKNREFNPATFLATIGDGRKNLTFAKKQAIFAQGDRADAVFYIQKGRVKLTVVSQDWSRSYPWPARRFELLWRRSSGRSGPAHGICRGYDRL